MSAAPKSQPKYSRRRPEFTPCYKLVQNHLSTFLADRDAEGRPVPDYVKKEFEAFLRCGILANGFLRLKCSCCHEEKIVGFSCKRRGFCPSCCAKRQAEAATHLVQNVLPLVPYLSLASSADTNLSSASRSPCATGSNAIANSTEKSTLW